MKTLTPKVSKSKTKNQKEQEVLFGLIEMFIQTGKPVGSNSLKDAGFDHLSSATIRNYFAALEEEGFLKQQHTSGGREPTEKAFRAFANAFQDSTIVSKESLIAIDKLKNYEGNQTYTLIRKALDLLAELSHAASFICSPRFDKDFVTSLRVVPIDHERVMVILVTDFGNIQPEVIYTDKKISTVSAKRIEGYLHDRLTGKDKLEPLEPEEETLARRIYNEVMVRFLVNTTNFSEEDVLTTGFSNLLKYGEFQEQIALSEGMSILENRASLRRLLRDTIAHESTRFWIGKDLFPFGAKSETTSILTIPYFIHQQPVGAIGILGPTRMTYKTHFGLLKALSDALSTVLTKNLYKFKITFRGPEPLRTLLPELKFQQIAYSPIKLIENRKK